MPRAKSTQRSTRRAPLHNPKYDHEDPRVNPDPIPPGCIPAGERERKRWTAEESEWLCRQRERDVRYRLCGELLGRTDRACRIRYHNHKKAQEEQAAQQQAVQAQIAVTEPAPQIPALQPPVMPINPTLPPLSELLGTSASLVQQARQYSWPAGRDSYTYLYYHNGNGSAYFNDRHASGDDNNGHASVHFNDGQAFGAFGNRHASGHCVNGHALGDYNNGHTSVHHHNGHFAPHGLHPHDRPPQERHPQDPYAAAHAQSQYTQDPLGNSHQYSVTHVPNPHPQDPHATDHHVHHGYTTDGYTPNEHVTSHYTQVPYAIDASTHGNYAHGSGYAPGSYTHSEHVGGSYPPQ